MGGLRRVPSGSNKNFKVGASYGSVGIVRIIGARQNPLHSGEVVCIAQHRLDSTRLGSAWLGSARLCPAPRLDPTRLCSARRSARRSTRLILQGVAAGPAKFVVSIILVLLLCRLSLLRVSVPVVFSYLTSGL